MSLAARLLNVFAIPGEVFEGVKASRFCVGNWLLPALLSAAVGVLTIIVVFSQPSIQRQVREAGEQKAKELMDGIPLHRMGQPKEIGQAVVFLCSEKAAYITGEVLHVNGGSAM
jgi:3-oxoacyl-[acyl-carrier protein] reductase